MGTSNDSCGSSECMKTIADMGSSITKIMSKQQEDGIKAIKELMETHHNNLSAEIKEFKQTVGKNEDEMFGRLRIVETDTKLIQAAIGTEGLDAKIKKVSTENSNARFGKTWKEKVIDGSLLVIATVLAAFIIAHYGFDKSPEVKEAKHSVEEGAGKK